MTITRNDVMPELLLACPSFGEPWATYCADPTFEADLHFVHAGEFARHLIKLLTAGCTDEFVAVFLVLERLHLEGDAYVQNLATVGFLEGIQNNAGNSGMDPESFQPFLRSATRIAWNQLNAFWGGEPRDPEELPS